MAYLPVLLVPLERLTKVDDAIEALEENLPQRESVHSEPGESGFDWRDRLGEFLVEPLANERHDARLPDRGRQAETEEFIRQAVVQRVGTGLLDGDPVSLRADASSHGLSFVHRHADAGVRQPLGQAQAADSRTDDQDMRHPGTVTSGCSTASG